MNAFGDEMKKMYGNRIFACADELYLRAELPLPDADYYEEYPQIENGVGMVTSMEDELWRALDGIRGDAELLAIKRTVSVATGTAAYPFFTAVAEKIQEAFPNITVHVYKIVNRFFGESVTVAGLLTGKDYWEQLRDKPLGEELLISETCLRNEEERFLCGMTLPELSEALKIKITPTASDGYAFLEAIFKHSI